MAKMETFDLEADAVIVVKNAKSLNPQKIGESLLATAARHNGHIHAENVLEEARDPNHPIHAHLEWDDAKCGHAYRLQQIRAIIRIVRVEDPTQELRRAFINITSNDGRSYRTLSDVLASQDLKDRILEQAQKDLEAWRARYDELKEIVALTEPALVELKRRRRKTTAKDGESRPSP
jgi:hypothetical protein